jgi:hypothetical protein
LAKRRFGVVRTASKLANDDGEPVLSEIHAPHVVPLGVRVPE